MSELSKFRSLDVFPLVVHLPPDTQVEELIKNEAVWHKSCNSKLVKAKERSEGIRKREGDDDEVCLSKSLTLSRCQNAKTERCILCGQALVGQMLKNNKFPLFRKQASCNKSEQLKTISVLQTNVALSA